MVECPASLTGIAGPSAIPHAGMSDPCARPGPLLLPETRSAPSTANATPETSRSAGAMAGTTSSACSTVRLQGAAVLRAQGDAPVPDSPAAGGEGRIGPGAHRRGVRRPPDRPALRKVNRGTVGRLGKIAGEHARDPPRRVGRAFPPPDSARSSSMRSGPSWPRRRRTATHSTRPTTWKGDTWDHVADRPPRAGWFRQCRARRADGRERRRGGPRLQAPHRRPADGPDHHRRLFALRGCLARNAYGETINPPRGAPGPGKWGAAKAPYKVSCRRRA